MCRLTSLSPQNTHRCVNFDYELDHFNQNAALFRGKLSANKLLKELSSNGLDRVAASWQIIGRQWIWIACYAYLETVFVSDTHKKCDNSYYLAPRIILAWLWPKKLQMLFKLACTFSIDVMFGSKSIPAKLWYRIWLIKNSYTATLLFLRQ